MARIPAHRIFSCSVLELADKAVLNLVKGRVIRTRAAVVKAQNGIAEYVKSYPDRYASSQIKLSFLIILTMEIQLALVSR